MIVFLLICLECDFIVEVSIDFDMVCEERNLCMIFMVVISGGMFEFSFIWFLNGD